MGQSAGKWPLPHRQGNIRLSTWPARLTLGTKQGVKPGEQREGRGNQQARESNERQGCQPMKREEKEKGGTQGDRGETQVGIKQRKNPKAGEENNWSQHEGERGLQGEGSGLG